MTGWAVTARAPPQPPRPRRPLRGRPRPRQPRLTRLLAGEGAGAVQRRAEGGGVARRRRVVRRARAAGCPSTSMTMTTTMTDLAQGRTRSVRTTCSPAAARPTRVTLICRPHVLVYRSRRRQPAASGVARRGRPRSAAGAATKPPPPSPPPLPPCPLGDTCFASLRRLQARRLRRRPQ